MKKNSLVILLILVTILKNMVWSGVVPLWHFPDEQSHFGQVQLYVETGKFNQKGNDLSRDIYLSEILLGTERDWAGKNKFTHHPEYKIEYTNSLIGKYEEEIKNFPLSYRKEFVKDESAGYPPLFYFITSIFYRLVYKSDLITRVFFSRISSILLSSLTIFVAYKVGEILFKKNQLLSFSLALLVSFQPMFTFISSGINSDNLMNFLFTALIFLSLKIIEKPKFLDFLFLFFVLVLGEYTKPHFKIGFLILPFLLLFNFKITFKYLIFIIISTLAFLTPVRLRLLNILNEKKLLFPDVYPDPRDYALPNLSFFSHLVWTVRHTIAEVIPWYWGVFKWLGVALPRTVNRVLNRLLIFAVFGAVLKTFKIIKNKSIKKEKAYLFMLYISLVYFLSLVAWDWLYTRSRGFSSGLQGRYYFPTIVCHMSLLIFGFLNLMPEAWQGVKIKLIKFLCLSMISLNFIALNTVLKAYYDLNNLTLFFLQLSQYKPWFFKIPYLQIIFLFYVIVLIILIKKILLMNVPKSEKKLF